MKADDEINKKHVYLHGLKVAASGNAQAFGFSILITVSYGIASTSAPPPTLGQQFGFAMSAVAAFSLLNVVIAYIARGESSKLQNKSTLLIASATDFIAVGAGLGAAIGVDRLVAGVAAWILIPFVAGLCYMLVQAFEFAVGREVDDAS